MLVTCDDIYLTDDGNSSFYATCEGTAPGVSNWTNALTCKGPTMNVNIAGTSCFL